MKLEKKTVDNKRMLFGKINILDLSVVLIIILAISLMCVKFNYTPIIQQEEVPVKYTMVVKGVRDYSVNAFKVGDIMYDSVTLNSMGNIVDIQSSPTSSYITDKNGDIKYEELPERFNLYLTLETIGLNTGKGLTTKTGEEIKLNHTITAFNQYCETSFLITSIQ